MLQNTKPDFRLINTKSNRAIISKNFRGTLKSIIQALGFRQISVMISLHTLTPTDIGEVWYSDEISEDDYLKAIDILAEDLCSDDYWNVLGLDLKNEPHGATWGDGSARDFRLGAEKLGNRMLKGCPQWITFIEGINDIHKDEFDGEELHYGDWWGAGLQNAATDPVELSIPKKIIWAPHYYTPSVYPQSYMFGSGGERGPDGAISDYVELSNSDLRARVFQTSNSMFGHLAGVQEGVIVLGEFGGIYSTDKHPDKTNQRVVQYSLEMMKQDGFGGGYMWSLNPESAYEYNPSDRLGFFTEGLLKTDWLEVNLDYVVVLRALDKMPGLTPFPCIKEK